MSNLSLLEALSGPGFPPGEDFVANLVVDPEEDAPKMYRDLHPTLVSYQHEQMFLEPHIRSWTVRNRGMRADLQRGMDYLRIYLEGKKPFIQIWNGAISRGVRLNPHRVSVNLNNWIRQLERDQFDVRALKQLSDEFAAMPVRAPLTEDDLKLLSQLSTRGYGQKNELFAIYEKGRVKLYRPNFIDYLEARLTNTTDARRELAVNTLASRMEYLNEHVQALHNHAYKRTLFDRNQIIKNLARLGTKMSAETTNLVMKQKIQAALGYMTEGNKVVLGRATRAVYRPEGQPRVELLRN